jgi:hypothetical protein
LIIHDGFERVDTHSRLVNQIHDFAYLPEVGTIYCMDRFENALSYNRKCKVVHEISTHYVFDVT